MRIRIVMTLMLEQPSIPQCKQTAFSSIKPTQYHNLEACLIHGIVEHINQFNILNNITQF